MKYCVIVLLSLLLVGCGKSINGELLFVEPADEDRFNFPYYLFIPDKVSKNEDLYVVIEPNNSGFADDDLQKHIEKAARTATIDYYLGNYIARNLNYPLLVPVFPRSMTNWKMYTHALDRDVMVQEGNVLERIDNQLIAMFEDAQIKLADRMVHTNSQFLLTGFSASGTFANRFTLLHPDKVLAVAAGGLNGVLMLPADSLKEERMDYPIGTADLNVLVGQPFERELFLETPQFYFMGELDENDAVPYADAFAPNEREQIYSLLGEQMQPERWHNCMQVYQILKVNATIKTFKEVGHNHPEAIKKEVVAFFREAIANAKHHH